jgi:hypothetical protein
MDEKTEVKSTMAPKMRRPSGRLLLVLGGVVFFAVIVLVGMGHAWHEHHDMRGTGAYGMGQVGFSKQFGGMGFRGGYMMHSALTGSISKISGNELTVTATNGVVTSVIANAQTSISKAGAAIKITDLKSGDAVTITGYPSSLNQLEAKTISVQ